MKKKLKLNLDLSSGYTFIGVSCPKKDYWLAYQLNNNLDFNFTRGKDFISFNNKLKKELAYSFFEHHDENSSSKFFLISNHHEESKLFAQLKNIDFIIITKDETSNFRSSDLVPSIRKTKGILLSNIIDTKRIKGFDNFIHDLEMIQ